MSDEIFDLFDDIDRQTSDEDEEIREKFLRAPFPYIGGKSHSVKHILPALPYDRAFIEVFGGSGAVILSRKPSLLEVFNDRYAGVTSFYRCIRDPIKHTELARRINMTPWSREEFMFCKQTWQDVSDDVERAARWFSMIIMSFSGIGRNFGRSTKEKTQQGKLWHSIEGFAELHERFKNITIENLDWRICLKDFDAEHAVFYLDPPYLNAYSCYEERQMLEKDHVEMLDRIFTMKGFVAVSGFENELYNSYPWSNVFLWDIAQSVTPYAFTETNKKKNFGNHTQRSEKIREYLWIKDFRPC